MTLLHLKTFYEMTVIIKSFEQGLLNNHCSGEIAKTMMIIELAMKTLNDERYDGTNTDAADDHEGW